MESIAVPGSLIARMSESRTFPILCEMLKKCMGRLNALMRRWKMWEEQCKRCTRARFVKATWDEPSESWCVLDRDEWDDDDADCPKFHEKGDYE